MRGATRARDHRRSGLGDTSDTRPKDSANGSATVPGVSVMTDGTPRRKLTFVSDPLGYLDHLKDEVVPQRRAESSFEHYTYGRMDQSARTGLVKIQASFDYNWECFRYCRPYREQAEGGRILRAFNGRLMFIHATWEKQKQTVQRHSNRLEHPYVSVPIGDHLAVLSDAPLGDNAVAIFDQEELVRGVVMKVRWKGSISSSRGFLPAARSHGDDSLWEAHHPSTGRRCFHIHSNREEAENCAIQTGNDLDGSHDGWYVRVTTEWKSLGRVRMKSLRELADSAKACGLHVVLEESIDAESIGAVVIRGVDWWDERFVLFRRENRWSMPPAANSWWVPPTLGEEWRIDRQGNVAAI
jgi:hypothetical protein